MALISRIKSLHSFTQKPRILRDETSPAETVPTVAPQVEAPVAPPIQQVAEPTVTPEVPAPAQPRVLPDLKALKVQDKLKQKEAARKAKMEAGQRLGKPGKAVEEAIAARERIGAELMAKYAPVEGESDIDTARRAKSIFDDASKALAPYKFKNAPIPKKLDHRVQHSKQMGLLVEARAVAESIAKRKRPNLVRFRAAEALLHGSENAAELQAFRKTEGDIAARQQQAEVDTAEETTGSDYTGAEVGLRIGAGKVAAGSGSPSRRGSVLLVHHPDIVIDVADVVAVGGRVPDLTIAGHTHGVQFRVPGIGALRTDTRTGRRYDRGLLNYRGIPF